MLWGVTSPSSIRLLEQNQNGQWLYTIRACRSSIIHSPFIKNNEKKKSISSTQWIFTDSQGTSVCPDGHAGDSEIMVGQCCFQNLPLHKYTNKHRASKTLVGWTKVQPNRVNRYIMPAPTCSGANLLLSPISICLIATTWPRQWNAQGIYRGSYMLNFYSNTTAACHVYLALLQLPDRMWWRERPGNLCRFDLRHLVHKSTLNLLDTNSGSLVVCQLTSRTSLCISFCTRFQCLN